MTRLLLILALALLLSPGNVLGAPYFKSTNTDGTPIIFRLSEQPCANAKVLEHIRALAPAALVDKFKAASLEWSGKLYASCYIVQGGAVYSIDEAGDPLQPIPWSMFKDDAI